LNFGGRKEKSRQEILEEARRERQTRHVDKVKDKSIRLIQSYFRKYRAVKALKLRFRNEWDSFLQSFNHERNQNPQVKRNLSFLEIIQLLRAIIFFADFAKVCNDFSSLFKL
jgi:hypothetical protein